MPSTRKWSADWVSSRNTPSMPGAVMSPENSRKNIYSQLRPWMGRDSKRTMFRPWTAKMVKISCREPLWWGTQKQVLTLSRSGRSSMRVEMTTKRVVLLALLLMASAKISRP